MARRIETMWPHLNERQRRLMLGVEARELGWGGIVAVAKAAGISRPTVRKALGELDEPGKPTGRSRRPGGGRKKVVEKDPGIVSALEALVEPETRGDPMSPLRWTTKSTYTLAEELTRQGHPASPWTVRKLLHQAHYSLQANAKVIEGAQHPDRDAQFRYINEAAKAFLERGEPVVSVDTKKKEVLGELKNAGREWRPSKSPRRVKVHDFADKALGKAIPFGVYDIGADQGWVSVGKDHDTAAFAVEALRRWWRGVGRVAYPAARRLLVCADAGGSNGYRLRLWKKEIAALAAEADLEITVSHFPPGTSKWNKIEHRLFAHISMSWRGQPLTSHEVVVELIGATTTRTGLSVHAELDEGSYPKGLKVSDKELASLPIKGHDFHKEWNYTVFPDRIPDP